MGNQVRWKLKPARSNGTNRWAICRRVGGLLPPQSKALGIGDEYLERTGDTTKYLTAEMIAAEVQIFGDHRFGTKIDAISIAERTWLVQDFGRGILSGL